MAILCPNCGAQYDVTLFQFERTVRCDCGWVVRLEQGHVIREERAALESGRAPRFPDAQPPLGEIGPQETE